MQQPSVRELREYGAAEGRLKESLHLRCNGIPMHDYPGRQEDLAAIQQAHAAWRAIPPEGAIARWWWFLKRRFS